MQSLVDDYGDSDSEDKPAQANPVGSEGKSSRGCAFRACHSKTRLQTTSHWSTCGLACAHMWCLMLLFVSKCSAIVQESTLRKGQVWQNGISSPRPLSQHVNYWTAPRLLLPVLSGFPVRQISFLARHHIGDLIERPNAKVKATRAIHAASWH
jgi:hypothetical protein